MSRKKRNNLSTSSVTVPMFESFIIVNTLLQFYFLSFMTTGTLCMYKFVWQLIRINQLKTNKQIKTLVQKVI